MAASHLSISKLKKIHEIYLRSSVNISESSQELQVTRNTFKRHLELFGLLEYSYPESIKDAKFCINALKKWKQPNDQHQHLIAIIPSLIEQSDPESVTPGNLHLKYRELYPSGYNYSQFCFYFSLWRKENKRSFEVNRYKIKHFTDADFDILKQWRHSTDRRKWERALVLIESQKGKSLVTIAGQVERSISKVQEWIKAFDTEGLASLKKKPNAVSPETLQMRLEKKENLMKLIHQTPKLHGINRTSWKLADLSATYLKVYGNNMSTSSISECLRKEGYAFRKAKEVLTSPDPNFREKLQHIKEILSNLGPKEKFFSVDEYGPFAIKIKGGRSLVKRGELKTYPQLQKSKGFLICTAALELSDNQVTHFYSHKKDTEEMIKLMDMVLMKYRKVDKLYFSWDAASWHASKKLKEHMEFVNNDGYREAHHTPEVELAPLPASAQFLNVIESVFSGLAKSIIHNSDYQSIDECKAAINRYFNERNQHFIKNPKRAGHKIWGKELVKSEFSEGHNCKDPTSHYI